MQALRNFAASDAFINAILNIAQRNGDILRLDLRVANFGPQGGNNPGGGFGNMGGRRLVDDVVDATFTMINNGMPLSDFVNANEVPTRRSRFLRGRIRMIARGNNLDGAGGR